MLTVTIDAQTRLEAQRGNHPLATQILVMIKVHRQHRSPRPKVTWCHPSPLSDKASIPSKVLNSLSRTKRHALTSATPPPGAPGVHVRRARERSTRWASDTQLAAGTIPLSVQPAAPPDAYHAQRRCTPPPRASACTTSLRAVNAMGVRYPACRWNNPALGAASSIPLKIEKVCFGAVVSPSGSRLR
jgi:hypothetical protein